MPFSLSVWGLNGIQRMFSFLSLSLSVSLSYDVYPMYVATATATTSLTQTQRHSDRESQAVLNYLIANCKLKNHLNIILYNLMSNCWCINLLIRKTRRKKWTCIHFTFTDRYSDSATRLARWWGADTDRAIIFYNTIAHSIYTIIIFSCYKLFMCKTTA